MAAPRKYPDELRERATRMAVQSRRDPSTRSETFRRVGEQLGINPQTLRNWVVQAEVDEGHRPGTTTSESQRLVESISTAGDDMPMPSPDGSTSPDEQLPPPRS